MKKITFLLPVLFLTGIITMISSCTIEDEEDNSDVTVCKVQRMQNDLGTTVFNYDESGKLLSMKNEDQGTEISFEYDGKGRIIKTVSSDLARNITGYKTYSWINDTTVNAEFFNYNENNTPDLVARVKYLMNDKGLPVRETFFDLNTSDLITSYATFKWDIQEINLVEIQYYVLDHASGDYLNVKTKGITYSPNNNPMNDFPILPFLDDFDRYPVSYNMPSSASVTDWNTLKSDGISWECQINTNDEDPCFNYPVSCVCKQFDADNFVVYNQYNIVYEDYWHN